MTITRSLSPTAPFRVFSSTDDYTGTDYPGLIHNHWAPPPPRPLPKRGRPNRRILRTIIHNGREWQLHATKGWRSYRVGRG